MKNPRLYKWNLTEKTEGLLFFSFLFFAQFLEELLFHHTLDSFKSPALNTHLNIFGLQFLSAEVFRNKVKAGALKPVLEELENRIKTDPAIEDQKDLCSEYHAKIKASIKHPDELFFSAKSLLNEIENSYWENLKSKIIETVPDKNQKKKILLLAICLASEIELRGHNKYFLFFMVLNFFFNGGMAPKKIDENTNVEDFLDTFDGELFEWQVIFRGCESFINFKEHLEGLELKISNNLPGSLSENVLSESRSSLPA